MNSYSPINCSFYDLIEHYAVLRKVIDIEFLDPEGGNRLLHTRILDTRHGEDGEYVLLEAEKILVRMDQLIALDGKKRM